MYGEEMLGGIMDGSSPEMKRLRRMLAASRAMDEAPSPEGNRQIAEAAGGLNGDMEITEVPPEPAAAPPAPAPAPDMMAKPQPPVPAAAPIPTPAKIGMNFSFNPNSDKANAYKDIVREFQGNRMAGEGGAGTYKDPSGLTRNMPQVYGQEGTPADPNEGPRTPEETAAELNRIETSLEGGVGGLEKQRKQHTLGYGLGFGPKNEARRKHYEQYVQNSRAADEQRREANRQRVAERGGTMTGGGTMGSYDNQGPSVSRQGGITILRGAGRYRPADSMEQAEIAYKGAQGEYARSRPADMFQDNQRQLLELQRKMADDKAKGDRFKQSFGQREQFFNEGMKHRKVVEQRLAAGQTAELAQDAGLVAKRMETLAQMMRVKLEAAKKATGLFGMGAPNPAAKDAWIDEKTMQADPDNIVPGDFDKIKDALATEIETLSKINPQAPLPESVLGVLQMLQGA
jgi:hypothetical protein